MYCTAFLTEYVPTVGRNINIGRPSASLRMTSSANDFVNEYVFGKSPIILKIILNYIIILR